MKALTIEQIRSRLASSKERERERSEKITAEEMNLSQLREAQNKAAEEGDFTLFEDLAEQIRKTEGKITVLMKMRNPDMITPEQLAASWTEYASKEEKELAAGVDAYKKKQKEAAADFEALVKKANGILQRQKEYAAALGIDPNTGAGKEKMNIRFEVGALIPYSFDPNFPRNFSMVPEFDYFGRAGLWNVEADKILIDVVRNHTAIDSIKFN